MMCVGADLRVCPDKPHKGGHIGPPLRAEGNNNCTVSLFTRTEYFTGMLFSFSRLLYFVHQNTHILCIKIPIF